MNFKNMKGGNKVVIEINEMNDYLEDFFESNKHDTIVGGIAGTQIEKLVLDTAVSYTKDFNRVLVVNGCQDYIEMLKQPVRNVVFWADLFDTEEYSNSPVDLLTDVPKIFRPKATYITRIIPGSVSSRLYDVMVVFNAHLIPDPAIDNIKRNFNQKIIFVIDPIECKYTHNHFRFHSDIKRYNIITDSINKVSTLTAYARFVIGVESRGIDESVAGVINIKKINMRSIGKSGKNYVSNDINIVNNIRNKQINQNFKRGMHVIVNDNNGDGDNTIITRIHDNNYNSHSIVSGSMLTIIDSNHSPMCFSPFLSKVKLYWNLEYDKKPEIEIPGYHEKKSITVLPANILLPHQIIYHRYTELTFVSSSDVPIPADLQYIILKNSKNVTIAKI